jgi:hypothetical protein
LNPDVCHTIKEYATSNLSTLSVEMMSEYIHNVVLPQLIENEVKESNKELDQESAREKILKQYGLTNICISIVYKWIKKLGFNYEARKKGYYVDGHKKEETVSYRWHYIERYLQYEQRMFRWIQITEEEAKYLEDKGTIKKGGGYRYNQPETGQAMVEYHVDTCDLFQQRMNEETAFGGRRSV